jgi:hypothetical protein
MAATLIAFSISPSHSDVVTSNSDLMKKCPKIIDSNPMSAQPKVIGFEFTGTYQSFTRLDESSLGLSTKILPLVGCYVDQNYLGPSGNEWQIGVINRDQNGFYWLNGAGITWRLTLNGKSEILFTDQSNPYFKSGDQFVLYFGQSIESTDEVRPCKLTDNSQNKVVRLDFPLSKKRISPQGSPKILLVVQDFADSPFDGKPTELVKQVLEPEKVKNFFEVVSFNVLCLIYIYKLIFK